MRRTASLLLLLCAQWSLYIGVALLPIVTLFGGQLSTAPVLTAAIVLIASISALWFCGYVALRPRGLLQERSGDVRPLLAVCVLLCISTATTFVLRGNIDTEFNMQLLRTHSALLIGALSILLALSAVLLRTRNAVQLLLLSLLCGVALSYGVEIFGAVSGSATTVVGTAAQFSIYAGFTALLSLVYIHTFGGRSAGGILAWVTLTASAFVLAGVSSPLPSAGITAILAIVFTVAVRYTSDTRPINLAWKGILYAPGVIFVLLMLLAVLLNSFAGLSLRDSEPEVRPSAYATVYTTAAFVTDRPAADVLFGNGAGTFSEVWHRYRPIEISRTPFASESFDVGVSTAATLPATTGLFGAFLWLLVVGLLYGRVFAALRKKLAVHAPLVIGLSLVTLYGWGWFFAYVPGHVVLALTVILSGALFVHASTLNLRFTPVQSQLCSPRGLIGRIRGVAGRISATLLIVVLAANAYATLQDLHAVRVYERAVTGVIADDPGAATELLDQVVGTSNTPLYHRTLSQTYQLRMNLILERAENNQLGEEETRQFSELAQRAIEHARTARNQNMRDHENWVALGNVYTYLSLLEIPNARKEAHGAYSSAVERAPYDPRTLFLAARAAENPERQLRRILEISPQYAPAQELLQTLRTTTE